MLRPIFGPQKIRSRPRPRRPSKMRAIAIIVALDRGPDLDLNDGYVRLKYLNFYTTMVAFSDNHCCPWYEITINYFTRQLVAVNKYF